MQVTPAHSILLNLVLLNLTLTNLTLTNTKKGEQPAPLTHLNVLETARPDNLPCLADDAPGLDL